MLNHYTTKITGPLAIETSIIHLSFLHFYTVIQGVAIFFSLLPKPMFLYKRSFSKIQSNIAIWQYIAIHSNTICNIAFTCIVSPLLFLITV